MTGTINTTKMESMVPFDEWKSKMMKLQEQGLTTTPNTSSGPSQLASHLNSAQTNNSVSKRPKTGGKNYASMECAKVVDANQEAEGTSRVVNEMMDEYMLNPCKAKIWFVIELCESIHARHIEIANFELFSSIPKDLTVYSSDTYPTRDWTLIGQFTAADSRTLQSFDLDQKGFGKFIRIEMHSHYGKEHYCPISVVRVFGTSMVDEYEINEAEPNLDQSSESLESFDRRNEAESKPKHSLLITAQDAVVKTVETIKALVPETFKKPTSTPVQNGLNHSADSPKDALIQTNHDTLSNNGNQSTSPQPTDAINQNQNDQTSTNENLSPAPAKHTQNKNIEEVIIHSDSVNIKHDISNNDIDNHTVSTTTAKLSNQSTIISKSHQQLGRKSKLIAKYCKRQDSKFTIYFRVMTGEQVSCIDKNCERAPIRNNITTIVSGFVGQPSTGQSKESVFVRLSNRVKVLELNVSLSSQYLEELSQRYRRQMDDLQHQLENSINNIKKIEELVHERDIYHWRLLLLLFIIHAAILILITTIIIVVVRYYVKILLNIID